MLVYALLDKIKNPIALIIVGVYIYITFDMWYVKLLGVLITTAGFSILAEEPTNKLKVLISNRFYILKKRREARNHLNYLETENDNDKLLSDFLKVLLSQDIKSFSRETLVSLLGDNYKDNRVLKNLVIGDGDYTQFNNDSFLHKLVDMGIINYNAHEQLFGKYSVSEDYWNALKGLYEEIHKSEKITFDSVYEHLFSYAK